MSVITLTTDFGTDDWFVGVMKGVLADLAPATRVVDITHNLEAGDIRGGSFALAASAPYFPAGTVHIAVVDPGVGSSRRAIALRTKDAVFVGPDNGVLSWAVRDQVVEEAHVLTNATWFLSDVSQTFHGRDIFAPVGARLSTGSDLSQAGAKIDDFVQLRWPGVRNFHDRLLGEVIHIDRFGNAITNLPTAELPAGKIGVSCGGKATEIHQCYADVSQGHALAIAGSSGLIELAVNGGDFADHYGVGIGTPVEARWDQAEPEWR